MKYPLLALAIFLLLAQLVSGNWYVKKCANKSGNCRSKCRTGEVQIVPPTGRCSKEKVCCVLNGKELNPILCGGVGAGGAGGGSSGGGGGGGSSTWEPSSGTRAPSSGTKATPTSETGTRPTTTPGAATAPASTTAKAETTSS